MMTEPPEGFQRLEFKSPFALTIRAEFFEAVRPDVRLIRTRVAPEHCNSLGAVHGGFMLTFADLALSFGRDAPGDTPPRITLHLSADFMRAARSGDWLEAEVRVRKQSSELIFAECLMTANGKVL